MNAPLNILVVEDTPADFRLLLRNLHQHGLEADCHRVASEGELNAALNKGGWDIVLSDYNVPGMEFRSTLNLIRLRSPDLPFILVSGSVGEEEAVELLKLGAWDFVLKERLARLVPCIERSLREAADRRARCLAETELRTSEQKYRLLFESSRDAFMMLAPPSWRFIAGNPAAVTMFRAENEKDFTSRSPWEYSPERQPDGKMSDNKGKEMIEKAMREGSHFFEWTHSRLNGEEFPATVLLTRFELNGQALLQATVRDISEQKLAVAERERLSAAIEQAAEIVMITDAGGTIQYVNPAFTRITGYAREEAIGKSPRILKSGRQDAAFYRRLWDTLTAGSVWQGRIVNKRKDGTFYEEENTISPVLDAEGKTVNYIALKLDVSHANQLEAQLRQAQKMEAVGQLAGGISHDFNNLLSVINGYAQILLVSPELNADEKPQIEEILRAGERAAGLTRQLLVFSRRQTVESKNIDLDAIISGIEKMLRRLIKENIIVERNASPDLCKINADPGSIEQVIMNLVINASDAMQDGGKLVIETGNVKIAENNRLDHPSSIKSGSYVMLEVSDTGCGMDDKVKERIFEPFFTTKEVGKGTGLGLATVYGIVRQINGYIDVQSEVGKGTSFRIYFPRVLDEGAANERRQDSVIMPHGGETILLVEDEDSLRGMIQNFLQSLGYGVLPTCSGKDALELAENHKGKIHLMLTDVIMPGMNGFELAKKVKSSLPEIKVLFMSGYTEPTDSQTMMKISDSFINKPLDLETLSAKLRKTLDEEVIAAKID